jgi:hypothetical protein
VEVGIEVVVGEVRVTGAGGVGKLRTNNASVRAIRE